MVLALAWPDTVEQPAEAGLQLWKQRIMPLLLRLLG